MEHSDFFFCISNNGLQFVVSPQIVAPLSVRATLEMTSAISGASLLAHKAINRLLSLFFYKLAQGLICYILYSWIPSLHSWRMNMDILRPRGFLCCASQDRKCSAWLLIGYTRAHTKWERWCDRRHTHTECGWPLLHRNADCVLVCIFKTIVSRTSTSVHVETFGSSSSVCHTSLSQGQRRLRFFTRRALRFHSAAVEEWLDSHNDHVVHHQTYEPSNSYKAVLQMLHKVAQNTRIRCPCRAHVKTLQSNYIPQHSTLFH